MKASPHSANPLLPALLVRLATAEIGVTEVNGSNCGPRVDQYKAATWLDPKKGWPWCAAFICWLVREALEHARFEQTKTFKRPRTAGAWDFENWCKGVDGSAMLKKPHRGDIEAGDIVVFSSSHIGIASGRPDKNGLVPTIEGNTDGAGSREGGAVLRKKRKLTSIRSRIRFTI
jgi:hypothetical protein